MEFNSTPGDLMELSPLFSDDSRVAEAASIAHKLRECHLYAAASITFQLVASLFYTNCISQYLILRECSLKYLSVYIGSFAEEDAGRQGVSSAVGAANASRGLEVAVANLQDYCNGGRIASPVIIDFSELQQQQQQQQNLFFFEVAGE
jgi:exocyst complex component 5